MRKYTLKALFLAMVLVAIVAASVHRLSQPTPIERIQRVLTSNSSDAQKAEYITQFLSVGDSYVDVLKRLQVSEPGAVGGGPSQTDIAFNSCDIVISFNPDRKLFRIGYYVQSSSLPSPEYHELVPAPIAKEEAN